MCEMLDWAIESQAQVIVSVRTDDPAIAVGPVEELSEGGFDDTSGNQFIAGYRLPGQAPMFEEQQFRRLQTARQPGRDAVRCDVPGGLSCKGRGVCPSCNTRRMDQMVARLIDHVLPQVTVRQWVLSLPKRLRYFLHQDARLVNAVLGIFLADVCKSAR